jgi:hypothetical protein
MALTERSRSAIYHGLSGVIRNEEAVGEMLSYFPARDVEEPATKEFVRAELALLRADLTGPVEGLRAEMQAESKRIIVWTVAANTTLLGLVLTLTGLA